MERILEAVYEEGVLKLLRDPGLVEHQRVFVELRPAPPTEGESQLRAWQGVYEGLSDTDVDAVEAIALDRSRFMSPDRE